nr:unnamed protein product [Callosobruchus chinensis]
MKDPTFLKSFADKVAEAVTKNMNKKLQNLETQISTLDNKLMESNNENKTNINKIMDHIDKINKEKNSLITRCDKMDQDCRKNNLRIFNMVEEERENIPQKIVELVTLKWVSPLQRIGQKTEQKSRAIFLSLKGYVIRNKIFNNKKLLKGTRVVIKEDLTTLRVNLMSRVIVKTSLKSAWTSEGKIYVKYNGKICKIVSSNDFDKIFS